jgi:hypothetical protein
VDISIEEQKVFLLPETITPDQARERAWDKKTAVFRSGIGSLFNRPKSEEIEVTYSEKRYEPFWFIVSRGQYVYDRTVRFPVKASGPEVKNVTVAGQEYGLVDDKKHGSQVFFIPGVEHCSEDYRKEGYFNGVSGEPEDNSNALKSPRQEIDLDGFAPDGLVVAPEIRASFVVRQLLQETIKPVQADKILEEHIIIERIELYFKPVYAYEYRWIPKERNAVAEFDGLSGQMHLGGKTLRQTISSKISRELLFDFGAEVAGMLVPGGYFAARLTQAALSDNKKKKK